MFDLLRRTSPRTLAAGALAAAVAAAGVVSALLGEYGLALAAVICLLVAVMLYLARANARLHRQLSRQHRQLEQQHRVSMRYAVKADKRFRTLDSRVSLLNRTLDGRVRETSADVEAATRRILAAVETERFAAAERHQAIAASLEKR